MLASIIYFRIPGHPIESKKLVSKLDSKNKRGKVHFGKKESIPILRRKHTKK